MPRRALGLTARQVATIAAPGFYAAGGAPGLYLQVTGGGRSWVYRFQVAGRRRDMGLGPADAIGLADAREKALAARRAILAGAALRLPGSSANRCADPPVELGFIIK